MNRRTSWNILVLFAGLMAGSVGTLAQQREIEPNNNHATANPLAGAMPFRFGGQVRYHDDDYDDFFRFRVVQAGHVKISLSHDSEECALYIGIPDPFRYDYLRLSPGSTGVAYVDLSNVGYVILVGNGPNGLRSRYLLTIESEPTFGTPGILEGVGGTQWDPILPCSGSDGNWAFCQAPSGFWNDPPARPGFSFTMTGRSLFTEIVDFPRGFSQPFQVIAEGKDYGTFLPGTNLVFDGKGVRSFQVFGIKPADPLSPTAFPLRLAFNTAYADFTMKPILHLMPPR